MIQTADLQERWERLWRSQGVRGRKSREGYALILRGYIKPGRACTLTHLAFWLNEFDRIRDQVGDPTSFELAVWYFGVFDFRGRKKDDRSGALACRQVSSLGGSAALARKTARLVLCARGAITPVAEDEKLIAGLNFVAIAMRETTMQAAAQ